MALPWVRKWQSLSPTSLWRKLKIETEILSQSATKPLVWKRFIDDVISIWNTTREEITQFIEQATAEISETETTFLDTEIYKGKRFNRES